MGVSAFTRGFPKVALQGNMESNRAVQSGGHREKGGAILKKPTARAMATWFNLGHGITPEVDPSHAGALYRGGARNCQRSIMIPLLSCLSQFRPCPGGKLCVG